MSAEPAAVTLAAEPSASRRAAAWAAAHRWPLAVWSAMLAWSVVLFATVRNDYVDFRLGRFDLGNMVQAVWSTAQGRPLETTALDVEVSRLAYHVEPVLALFAPLWLVWPSPLALVAVQVAGCALGALPVFWLARRHLASERAGAILAFAYLAFPWVAWTTLDAVHPVTLAIPLFLFAIWFLDTGKIVRFAVCAVLALACGELMGLALAGLGIWYWLARGERRAGLLIAAAGAAWSTIAVKVVIPALGSSNPFSDRFASVGGTPEGILRTAVTDPGVIVDKLVSHADLVYALYLATPLLGLFLLAPGLAAVALPQLLINGLSDSTPTTDPRAHYIAAAMPFLIAASVFGLARVPRELRARLAGPAIVLFAVLTVVFGPWAAIAESGSVGIHDAYPSTHLAALKAAVAVVPASAPVTATNRAASQLSARRYVYNVPVLGRATWLVLDTWEPRVAEPGRSILYWEPKKFKAFTRRIERSPSWTKVYERDGVLVFRKTGDG